jgi:hypothetical protein
VAVLTRADAGSAQSAIDGVNQLRAGLTPLAARLAGRRPLRGLATHVNWSEDGVRGPPFLVGSGLGGPHVTGATDSSIRMIVLPPIGTLRSVPPEVKPALKAAHESV